MSRTRATLPPRVVEQHVLFGGIDVVTLYGEGGRTRSNTLNASSFKDALRLTADAVRVEGADAVAAPSTTRCPHCGHCGDVDADFGWRILRGERLPQSWCKGCRARARAA